MEADWSVEVGADLPMIAVPWEGFVDLRRGFSSISEIHEAFATPELAQALIRLNRESSRVFTSKCDVWALTADEIDPLEFDAEKKNAEQGIACYIDMILRDQVIGASFKAHEQWVRSASTELRRTELPQARVELVVRPANVDANSGFGITLYVAACGADAVAATSIFQTALDTSVAITMKQAATTGE